MKTTLHNLRTYIMEALIEQADMPGRWMTGDGEPMSKARAERLNNPSDVEYDESEDLDEVDTDPSNNPGRPDDPYEYIGMHTKPGSALSHPAISGGVPTTGTSGTSSGTGDEVGTDTPDDTETD
jgi:hypothetical protein